MDAARWPSGDIYTLPIIAATKLPWPVAPCSSGYFRTAATAAGIRDIDEFAQTDAFNDREAPLDGSIRPTVLRVSPPGRRRETGLGNRGQKSRDQLFEALRCGPVLTFIGLDSDDQGFSFPGEAFNGC